MKRLFILCLCWLAIAPFAQAQSLVKLADKQFDQLAYVRAAELYEQALLNTKSMTEGELRAVRAKLAYSYRQLHDTPKAEKAYRDLIGAGELPTEYAQNYLFFAQALASNGKYPEAQEAYEKYENSQKEDPRGAVFSKLYRDVSKFSKNAGSYKVSYLTVNTQKPEFSPVYYKNGIVFVSTGEKGGAQKRVFGWNNTPFLDLFYAPEIKAVPEKGPASLGTSNAKSQVARRKAERTLGRDAYTASTSNDSRTVGFYGGLNLTNGGSYDEKPATQSEQFSKNINSKYHEGPATFSRNGSRVIFTRNNYNAGKYGKSSDGLNKLKLYTATQRNGKWGEATELPFNSDDYSVGHPSLSDDDKRLYFASDMPGGFGGTDIYVSYWNGKSWGKPINMGENINTRGNEMFPFVDAKGNLYFASDGLGGLGGLDIFFAELNEKGDQTPKSLNLGEPINSEKDDFGLITDGDRKMGYFSSNRKNGGVDDDIYQFSREGPMYACRELIVSVIDAATKMKLDNALVSIQNNDVGGDNKQLKTDSSGTIRLCLNAENDFKFAVSHAGYTDNLLGFSTRGLDDDQPTRLDIPLAKPAATSVVSVGSPTIIRGRITTQTDKLPIEGAKVVMTNNCDSLRQETTTGPDGSYEFSAKPGCEYTIDAIKEDMGTMTTKVSKEDVGPTDIAMFKAGDIIQVDNIYYDLDKSDIRPDAAFELDKLADLMMKYPAMKIELRSHTDSRATTRYNKRLSNERAKSAVDYLKEKGVAGKRLKAVGLGESMPVNKCIDGVDCTEEEHQQNRRTEIKILTVK